MDGDTARPARGRPYLRRYLAGALAALAILYGGVLAYFVLREPSLVYVPHRGKLFPPPDSVALDYRRVEMRTPDSLTLVGWIVPATAPGRDSLWVLYLHGQAHNISHRSFCAHYRNLARQGLNVLALDYRGFGESQGHPDEPGLYRDAETAYRYLRDSLRVPPARIAAYGFSLGTAVAVDLAAREPMRALILEGSFTSLPDVGQARYPYIPVRLLARNRFDALAKIGSVAAPKLFLHARADHTVPARFGRGLFAAAPPPKAWVELAGDHSTAYMADSAALYGAVRDFLARPPAVTGR